MIQNPHSSASTQKPQRRVDGKVKSWAKMQQLACSQHTLQMDRVSVVRVLMYTVAYHGLSQYRSPAPLKTSVVHIV